MKNTSKILVAYIDVGSLPPEKASHFVDQMSERIRGELGEMPGVKLITFPVRNQPTRLEYIDLN